MELGSISHAIMIVGGKHIGGMISSTVLTQTIYAQGPTAMLDPITAIATASAAYNALKKGIQVGRELQDMGGQLAQWAGAVSDLDFLAKKAEDPPWWKVGGNVQGEAIELFAAKKKIEAQRAELKTYIQYSYGQSGWEELLRIEAQVRKRKQATDHRRAEMKELLITITIVGLALLAGVGGLALLAYFLVIYDQR